MYTHYTKDDNNCSCHQPLCMCTLPRERIAWPELFSFSTTLLTEYLHHCDLAWCMLGFIHQQHKLPIKKKFQEPYTSTKKYHCQLDILFNVVQWAQHHLDTYLQNLTLSMSKHLFVANIKYPILFAIANMLDANVLWGCFDLHSNLIQCHHHLCDVLLKNRCGQTNHFEGLQWTHAVSDSGQLDVTGCAKVLIVTTQQGVLPFASY